MLPGAPLHPPALPFCAYLEDAKGQRNGLRVWTREYGWLPRATLRKWRREGLVSLLIHGEKMVVSPTEKEEA